MATTQLNTKIKLRYDTLENWQKTDVAGKGGNLILLQGEVAFCEVPNTGISGGKTVDDTGTHNYRPTVLFKVGAKDENGNLQAFKDLPWGSALAADVYSWAKEANKPSYNADEIDLVDASNEITPTTVEGAIIDLYDTIASITGGSSNSISTQIATQIASLTPDDTNAEPGTGVTVDDGKYITGLKVDSNGVLQLTQTTLPDWTQDITDAINDALDDLDFADGSATTGAAMSSGDTVVTSVTQTNGQIAVTKQSLGLGTAARRDATATSHTITDADAAVATKEDGLVSAAQVAEYVIDRTAALTGATHFRGTLATAPAVASGAPEGTTDLTTPTADSNSIAYAAGDIALYGTSEYIFDGTKWILLGDEGIYATKTALTDGLAGKVDKVNGYSLLADTEITRLAGIEDGAEVNDVTDVTVGGTSVVDGSTKVAALGAMAGKTEVAYSDLESTLAADIDGKLDGVNASIATVDNNNIVTIKGGLEVDSTTTAGTNTVVNTANTNDITLAKVAKTGLITDLDLGDGLILDGGNAEIPAQTQEEP